MYVRVRLGESLNKKELADNRKGKRGALSFFFFFFLNFLMHFSLQDAFAYFWKTFTKKSLFQRHNKESRALM